MDTQLQENDTTFLDESNESNNNDDKHNNNNDGDEEKGELSTSVRPKVEDVFDVMGREEQELARRQYPDDDVSSEPDQIEDDSKSNINKQISNKADSSPRDSNDSGSQIYDSNANASNRSDYENYSQSNCTDHQTNNTNQTIVNGNKNDCFNGHENANNNRQSQTSDEPEQMRKLFIGGLDYKTSEAGLKHHFEQFGEVIDCVVMRDPQSQRSRGFGFVIYKHSSMVDRAQDARPHEIEGREVQSKRAISREDSGKPEAQATVKRVYLGGISDDIEESELRSYFKEFGNIVNINMVTHKDTGKRRGFAFAEFDDYDAVDKIVLRKFHTIKEKRIEAKKAIPKNEMDARKRVDPRMSMAGSMVTISGPPIDGPRSRGVRSSDACLWDGPYGGSNYQSGYVGQANYGYPAHPYHSANGQYGAGNWIMNPGGGASGGPYGGGFRGPHGNSYGGRNNQYNPAAGSWPGSGGPDHGGFPAGLQTNIAGGSGGVTGAGGPIRLTHQYRWGPYGASGGYGGAHRGRGHNS